MSEVLTIGNVADRFHVHVWQVRRLFESGRLPEPPRAGPYRVFSEDDLPSIESALRSAGYLSGEAVAQ